MFSTLPEDLEEARPVLHGLEPLPYGIHTLLSRPLPCTFIEACYFYIAIVACTFAMIDLRMISSSTACAIPCAGLILARQSRWFSFRQDGAPREETGTKWLWSALLHFTLHRLWVPFDRAMTKIGAGGSALSCSGVVCLLASLGIAVWVSRGEHQVRGRRQGVQPSVVFSIMERAYGGAVSTSIFKFQITPPREPIPLPPLPLAAPYAELEQHVGASLDPSRLSPYWRASLVNKESDASQYVRLRAYPRKVYYIQQCYIS